MWDVPTSINCGFINITVSTTLSDTYNCKTDKRVSEFSVEGGAGVSITNNGILTFESFSRLGDNIVKITANNIAGNCSKSYTITIKQGSDVKNEVKITLYYTSYMDCISTEQEIRSKITKTQESTLSQSNFDKNLPYGIKFQFASFFYGAYIIEAYVNFDTVGEYTILNDIDGISQIWLGDKLIVDITSEVHISNYDYVKGKYNVETTGYVKIKVMGFIGYFITCGSGDAKINLKFSKPGSTAQESFKFYQSIYYLYFFSLHILILLFIYSI